ncbi:MAG: RimK family alpha-L-glutamate ligase [Halodesulfurarchaeum sp.]
MLTVGLAHFEETAERIQEPLRERDIAVKHVSITEDVTDLTGSTTLPDVDVGLFFPGRIPEGGVLTALLDIPWVNGREAVLRSRNKAETIARLEGADLPVPETTVVSNPADESAVAAAVDRLGTPAVLKPNSTTRGVGILKVRDPDSLSGVTDYLELIHEFPVTRDRTYLLQEYLPEARDVRVMVIDGEVVGAVERELPDESRSAGRWKHNVHRGATARGIDPAPEIQALARRTAAVMDVPVLGVDVLDSPERTVVSETNARPTIDAASKYDPDFYDRLAELLCRTADRTGR